MCSQAAISVTEDRRLLIEPWENAQGRKLVTVTPQYQDRGGNWRLEHSGLMISTSVARALAPILTKCADAIDSATQGEAGGAA